MKFNKTSNPSFGRDVFQKAAYARSGEDVMTIEGAANKTFMLLLLAIVSASLTWKMYFAGSASVTTWMIGGLIGGLIFALISIFSKKWIHITAPAYAVFEGLFLGGISALFEASMPGLVLQAIGLTFGVFITMLLLYRFRIIEPTEKFKSGIVAATGGVFLVYSVNWILSMFGMSIPFLHEGGWIGIGVSLVIVVIAALNLILDFAQIEEGAQMGAPKKMEWYGAFGLMVTLVWLYLEILRLLSKISSD